MATVLENLQSIQGMIRGCNNISSGDFDGNINPGETIDLVLKQRF